MSRPRHVTDETERALQRSLDHLQSAIDRTLATMHDVENNHVADNGPLSVRYFNDMPALGFSELSKPPPGGIRRDLRNHLRILLQQRHGQVIAFHRHHDWLVLQELKKRKPKSATRPAVSAAASQPVAPRTPFVRSPPSAPAPPPPAPNPVASPSSDVQAQLKQLAVEADKNLNRRVNALIASPSLEGMRAVTEGLRDPLLLGASTAVGAPARAMGVMQQTASRQALRANADYLAKPSDETGSSLAKWVRAAFFVGCSSDDFKPALDTLNRAANGR